MTELKTNFGAEDLRALHLARIVSGFREGEHSEAEKPVPIAARRSLNDVTEYKKTGESDDRE
jgi:predicted transcriptional regulator